MAIPEYRNRFSFYLNEFLDQYIQIETLQMNLYAKRDSLAPLVAQDPFYRRDYGFDIGDFRNAFDEAVDAVHTKTGLLAYLEQRKATALDQLDLQDISPILNVDYDDFSNTVQLTVRDDQGLQSLQTCMINQTGNENCEHTNFEIGVLEYQISTSFLGNAIPNGIYFQAIDNMGNISRFPSCNFLTINPITTSNNDNLFINEIMASNQTTIADEAGEFDDWLELYNASNEPVNLDVLFLSDNPDNPDKWDLPDVEIPALGYLLIWADEDGSQGDLHANFRLNREGEFIGIFDTEANGFALIDGFSFGPQEPDRAFGRLPDGGSDLTVLDPTPEATNNLSSTSIDERLVKGLKIYPNPANNFIAIDLNQLSILPQNIIIENGIGQLLYHNAQISNLMEINVANWDSGIYFLRLDFGSEGQLTRKVVVSK